MSEWWFSYAPRVWLGDVQRNALEAQEAIKRAEAVGAAVLLLPLHALTGATCGDLLKGKVLRSSAWAAAQALCAQVRGGLSVVLTLPDEGESVVAVLLREGAIAAMNEIKDGSAAVGGYLVALNPAEVKHRPLGIKCLFWPHATPWTVGSREEAVRTACAASLRLGIPVVAAGAGFGESTTDAGWRGQCLVCSDGLVLAEGDEAALAAASGAPVRAPQPAHSAAADMPWLPGGAGREAALEETISIQAAALGGRMAHIASKRPVIALSGGLDSALALLAALRAQAYCGGGAADVVAVTMPGMGTSGRTRGNADALCRALGLALREIPIGDMARERLRAIGHDGQTPDVTYENAQARTRTAVALDLANKEAGLMVGPGDLSELALGFTTYGGDHLSSYGVNGGIPKTVVRLLAAHEGARLGGKAEQAIRDILDTPISPELLPTKDGAIAQHTERQIGPYELHDVFLYAMLRYGAAPDELSAAAEAAFRERYTQEAIDGCRDVFLKRFFAHAFKRSCMPDGPAPLGLSLSPRAGLAMPSDMSDRAYLPAR